MMTKPLQDFTIEKLLYRAEEASFALGISHEAVTELISKGGYKTTTYDGVLLIPCAEVRRLAKFLMSGPSTPGERFKPVMTPETLRPSPSTALIVSQETLWTTKEVAERLRCSVDCVKKWISSGDLERTKAGGRTLITEAALQAFVRLSTERQARK